MAGTALTDTALGTRPGNNKVAVINEDGTLRGWTALKVTGPR